MNLFSNILTFMLSGIITQVTSRIQLSYLEPIGKDLGLEAKASDFLKVSSSLGFYSEEYKVITEDGYILKLFRIVNPDCGVKKQTVLLMHGLMLSSEVWLDSKNNSIAYMIASNCYDLWIGNIRGNYNGRKHVSLNPDKHREFWDFSYHEMGYYDLPAILDTVQRASGSPKISYIGYSQGGAIYLIMCATRPHICENINLFIGLAPSSRMINTKSQTFRLAFESLTTLKPTLVASGFHEMFGRNSFVPMTLDKVCTKSSVYKICHSSAIFFDSNDPGSLSKQTVQNMFKHIPAGTSLKNLLHFSQAIRSKKFQNFDYGRKKNLYVYGHVEPQTYDLSIINTPTVILGGLHDYIIDIKDLVWLKNQLPNAALKIVDHPYWNHLDFPYSIYAGSQIYPTISQYLEKFKHYH